MGGSNSLWSVAEAAHAMNGQIESGQARTVNGVSIDSRTLESGDLFFAIKGENGDGHDYVSQALKNGAGFAVVSQKPEGVPQDRLIVVDDTLNALQNLGKSARERTSALVIGVTGSVGKTSTKELLSTAFTAIGQTHASKKSYNNHWGVPLSLANMHAGADFAIFEMGMNHTGEITPLVKQVQPHIAIITTIEPVHVGNFEKGIEGVAEAKAEIFEGVSKNGCVILNRDNEWFSFLSEKAKNFGLTVFSFGESEDADCRLLESLEAANGSRVKARVLGEDISYTLRIAGRHIVMNSLAVLLAVKIAKADVSVAAKAIEKMEPIVGRGKREYFDIGDKNNPVTLIDESYNASPASMRAAFKVLALIDPGRGGRRIAFLGDMLELGSQSVSLHAELSFPLKASNIDLVYTCGKMMKNLQDQLPANQRGAHRENSAELAQIVPDVLVPGDVVMVKGSLGSKMGTVVEALRALPNRARNRNML